MKGVTKDFTGIQKKKSGVAVVEFAVVKTVKDIKTTEGVKQLNCADIVVSIVTEEGNYEVSIDRCTNQIFNKLSRNIKKEGKTIQLACRVSLKKRGNMVIMTLEGFLENYNGVDYSMHENLLGFTVEKFNKKKLQGGVDFIDFECEEKGFQEVFHFSIAEFNSVDEFLNTLKEELENLGITFDKRQYSFLCYKIKIANKEKKAVALFNSVNTVV